MSEGRRAAVKLLDGENLPVVILPRSTVEEILLQVSEHLGVRHPDTGFFGIVYIDESGQFHWLPRDRRVYEFEFPRKALLSRQIQLYHRVRYFVDSIYQLEHASSIELFFMEAMQQLSKGLLDLTDVDLYRIAAFMLQIYLGDFRDNGTSVEALRVLVPTPMRLLSAYGVPVVQYERIVTERHEDLRGMSRGTAIINFMSVVERSSTYGSRYYRVTDKTGIPYSLALNSRGIYQFDSDDYSRPKKVFYWKFLDNLYYRDRRFSIEVRDSRRIVQSSGDLGLLDTSQLLDDELARAVNEPTTQVSVSRRGLAASTAQVHNFYCDSPIICKSLWSAAIAQHQFFIEQQTVSSKRKAQSAVQAGVNLVELSEKLTRLVSRSSIGSSLPSLSSLHSASSCGAMPSAKVADGGSSCASLPSLKNETKPQCSKTEEEKQRDRETFKELRNRKDELEERLRQKLASLREICVQEGELTGEMPKEMRRALMPGEDMPKLKKRVSLFFQWCKERVEADKISQLEADVLLHKKIVAAAQRLATDKSMNKSVRKKRQRDLASAVQKLKKLEFGLSELKLSASKPDMREVGNGQSLNGMSKWNEPEHTTPSEWSSTMVMGPLSARSCPTTPRGSIPDLRSEADEKSDYEEDFDIPRPPSSFSANNVNHRHSGASNSSGASSAPGGLPPSGSGHLLQNPLRRPPLDELENPHASSSKASLPHQLSNGGIPIYENIGYRTPAYVSEYRQSQYPTLTGHFSRVQRAQSEHALAQAEGGKGAMQNGIETKVSYGGGMELSSVETWHASGGARRVLNGTRMHTSQSCTAGFSTASLDRRAAKARKSPQTVSASVMPDAPLPSSPFVPSSRPSQQRMTTTFPVSGSSSTSSISPLRATGFESTKHSDELTRSPFTNGQTRLPSYNSSPASSAYSGSPLSQGYGSGSSIGLRTSGTKLPTQNPHMEALLDYYKEKSKPSPPKTATIV